MINQRVFEEKNYVTSDWEVVPMKHFSKESTQMVEENWPDDYDFVVRTAGGGRKLTGNHLGAVWTKEDKPKLNMGLTPIKAKVPGVFERFKQIDPDEIMWFTQHPFMSVKDITRWYVKRFEKEAKVQKIKV